MRPPDVSVPGHVILVGMMGTGKTTVGRAIGQGLGRSFVDTDELIELRTGRSIREMFEIGGEDGFRSEESAALAQALAVAEPSVIAAGGGAVISMENRSLMQRASRGGGIVVWLRADPEVLAGRVGPTDHRPLLGDDALDDLTALAVERDPMYREVADAVIDEVGPEGVLSVAEVSGLVLAAVAPGLLHARRRRNEALRGDPRGTR